MRPRLEEAPGSALRMGWNPHKKGTGIKKVQNN
jgi:hypothetical protein